MKPFDISKVPRAEGVAVVLRDGAQATAFMSPGGQLHIEHEGETWGMNADGSRWDGQQSSFDIVGFLTPPVVRWAVVNKQGFIMATCRTKEAAKEIAGRDRVVKLVEVPDTDED